VWRGRRRPDDESDQVVHSDGGIADHDRTTTDVHGATDQRVARDDDRTTDSLEG
jgi:hypothetical protein